MLCVRVKLRDDACESSASNVLRKIYLEKLIAMYFHTICTFHEDAAASGELLTHVAKNTRPIVARGRYRSPRRQ